MERRRWQQRARKPMWLVQGQMGYFWQITPRVLLEAVTGPDPAAAQRAFMAMMPMKKIDIAKIEAAVRG